MTRSLAARLGGLRSNNPARADLLVVLATAAFGALLFAVDLSDMFGVGYRPVWPQWTIFALMCAVDLLRRKAPVLALGVGLTLTVVDCFFGLSVPVLIVLADLLYSARLFAPRKISDEIPALAVFISICAVVAALVAYRDWRTSVATGITVVPFVLMPVWWATTVRQHREIADAERVNSSQLSRIAELDRQAAVARERGLMARDLHDVIAGHLSAISILSEAALTGSQEYSPQVRDALTSIRRNGVSALEEMRAMIVVLRADRERTVETKAPRRLTELPQLLDSVRASGITVEVRKLDGIEELPAAVDLVGYRIVQEALTNVLKHAPEQSVSLLLERNERAMTLEVSNTVSGEPTQLQDGWGLVNMRERADAVGGTFDAGPSDIGWTVRAELPIGVSA